MARDRLYYAWVLPAGSQGLPGELAYAAYIPGDDEAHALAPILANMRNALLISGFGIMPADQSAAPAGEQLTVQNAVQFLTTIVHSSRFNLNAALLQRVTGIIVPTGALAQRYGRAS